MRVICQGNIQCAVALAYHSHDGGVLKYRLKTVFVSALCVCVLVTLATGAAGYASPPFAVLLPMQLIAHILADEQHQRSTASQAECAGALCALWGFRGLV